jgi:hypothetical protein
MERVDEQLPLRGESFNWDKSGEKPEGVGKDEMATENIGPRYCDEDLLAFGSIATNDG